MDKKKNFGFIMALFLLGIFMGAIDTGIVSPARVIIQNSFGVDEKTGVWIITIYTLTYAAIIPFSGKLADKLGRKYVYIVSIALFGIGSAICGLSSLTSSFSILLLGRIIQALGGGGIMPIATAEFGTSFPEEKRGMALGLVGATYGVANILGSSIGSVILSIFGNENWKWIFFVNVPISILIVVSGFFIIPNTKMKDVKKIDKLGTLIIVGVILSLLYGLKNIDFFDFSNSIKTTSVYPYLIIFICLIPFFILAERKAEDPVLNLQYFANKRILITLILSVIVGIGMMGMVFVPQYAENALKMPSGSGGYFVAILGIFAGIAGPISGKLIDQYGAKVILLIGFILSMLGSLFLIFVAIKTNTIFTVCISLILLGLGLGFTMGTPLNYMMLENTKEEEANSALATLSLIRSIGVAISPAIMIGFIAHAGLSVQDNLMNIMPKISTPKITQAEELKTMINSLKSDSKTSEMLKNVTIPNFNQQSNIDMNSSNSTLPEDLKKKLQTSDVTNITDRAKELSIRMFDEKTPPIISKIQNGVQTGIDNMQKGLNGISKGEKNLKKGIAGVETGITQMNKALSGITIATTKMQQALDKQDVALSQMNKLYSTMENMTKNVPINSNIPSSGTMPNLPSNDSIPSNAAMPKMPSNSMPISGAIPKLPSKGMPSGMRNMNLKAFKSKITELGNARLQLASKLEETKKQKRVLENKIEETKTKKQSMIDALSKMESQKTALQKTLNKAKELKTAVPVAFENSKKDYLNKLESKRSEIENVFQSTINTGFKQMYIAVFFINLLASLVLLFYKKPDYKNNEL